MKYEIGLMVTQRIHHHHHHQVKGCTGCEEYKFSEQTEQVSKKLSLTRQISTF